MVGVYLQPERDSLLEGLGKEKGEFTICHKAHTSGECLIFGIQQSLWVKTYSSLLNDVLQVFLEP